MSKFVVPTSRPLQLSGDTWIEVKDELSVGDIRKAAGWINGFGPAGERRGRMSPGFAQTMAFLLDWNFKGPDGKDVVIDTDARREAGLDALRKEDYDEIEEAIGRHIDVVRQDRDDAKKKTAATTSTTDS